MLTPYTFWHVALYDLTKNLGQTEPELNNTSTSALDYGRELSSNKDPSDDNRQAVSDDVVLLEEKMKGPHETISRGVRLVLL